MTAMTLTELRDRLIEAEDASYVGTIAGRVVILREIGRGKDSAEMEAYVPHGKGAAIDYTVRIDRKYGHRSDPGPWGLNLQGWGPWVDLKDAGLASEMIALAVKEATRRNEHDALSGADPKDA